jgi:hypothetical protein
MTRFYFHNVANATSGLPSSEQSTLTVGQSAEGGTASALNKTMNTTIGTGQLSLAMTISGTVAKNCYYTRFVSVPLFQTSIAANTWTYNFAAAEASTFLNFPVNGTNQPVRVNCYVWRPSTSTKIGTILDGNTASTVTEGTNNQIRSQQTTFAGAAVSSMQNGDVVILEIWFIVTPQVSFAATFYYDGTTVNTTAGSTVTNHASFLETPETLTLAGAQHFDRTASDTVTLSDGVTRRKRAIRPIPGESFTIADGVSRFMDVGRAVTATLTISAPAVRVYRTAKSIPQSFTIVVDALGEKLFHRVLNEDIIILADANRTAKLARIFPESISLSVTPARIRRILRPVTGQTLAVNATAQRAKRFVRTANNTLTIADSVLRDLLFKRTIAEPVTIVANTVKSGRIRKTVNGTLSIVANTARVKRVLKTINESFTIAASVSAAKRVVRVAVSEILTITDAIARRLKAARIIAVPITVVGTGGAHVLTLFERTVNSSLTVVANASRIRRVPRIIAQSISITTAIISKLCSGYE